MNRTAFLELLNRNEEFTFNLRDNVYELVYIREGVLSLYLANDIKGTLIENFTGSADFLVNCKIDGQSIYELLDEIKV